MLKPSYSTHVLFRSLSASASLRILITLFAIIASTIYATAQETPILNPDWSAILPAAHAREVVNQCSRPASENVDDVWVPAAEDIAALEPALEKLLAEELAKPHEDDFAASSAADYYRQYAGLIVGGRRIVYVNGIHRSLIDSMQSIGGAGWREEIIFVCSGGTYAFGVEYNPETKTFANFAFNELI